MASGFTGGGDFYGSTGFTGSAMINNNLQVQQFRSQISSHDHHHLHQQQLQQQMGAPIVSSLRRNGGDFGVKRSIAELEKQQLMQHQVGLLRSVKQRSQFNHSSPISPLSPYDHFSPDHSARFGLHQGRFAHPFVQQVRSNPNSPIIINNNNSINSINNNASNPTSVVSFSSSQVVNSGGETEAPLDSERKMRNRLQELEKQLLDDDEDAVNDDDCDVSSVVTSSEWSETMQNLMSPPTHHSSNNNSSNPTTQQQQQQQIPFSTTSPTSSSNSSCSSTLTTSSSSSLTCSPRQSLMEAATAISEAKTEVAASILDRLKQVSNTRGDPEQRLTAYMVSALRSRLNPMESPPPISELCSPDHIVATQLLYEASPCFKLGFMAANEAILESTKPQSQSQSHTIHILDFDLGQGSQYVTLIYRLAERQSSAPTTLKISTLIDPSSQSEDRLGVVGDFLTKLAERVGLKLKFKAVNLRTSDLSRDALFCDPDEALAVNFAFRLHKLADESVSTENPRDELLRLVKGLRPRVVTVVEQEMNCNTNTFVARVAEASGYYQAVFDSLDSAMTREGSDRVRIEECLGRKAANSVACEGRDRVERCEVFGKWRARMGMAGFELKPLSQHVAESMRARLNSLCKNGGNSAGFTVKEENGGISFGWKGRTLTVVSAWR